MSQKDKRKEEKHQPREEITLSDPCTVAIIFHEKKGLILRLLIEKEMTIIELKHATGMNPGTIKRHLDDLLKCDLIRISKEKLSEYSIVMKYYRAVAKKFNFDITWSGK
ncbi:MAG: winged helix-turn-helix transcriptional regulator [Candidatus Heimdallarchaeota archaeon]|nr:winged helix-turn-helix transcriptional regulator [Candidatus Heimdallarchaeota archaeon]